MIFDRDNLDIRCVDGRLMRHLPSFYDPYYEADVGQCQECAGKGCDNLFPVVSCSQCGKGFEGPRRDGFSHCHQHKRLRLRPISYAEELRLLRKEEV